MGKAILRKFQPQIISLSLGKLTITKLSGYWLIIATLVFIQIFASFLLSLLDMVYQLVYRSFWSNSKVVFVWPLDYGSVLGTLLSPYKAEGMKGLAGG